MKNFEIPITIIVNASTAQEAIDQLGEELDYLCNLDNQVCAVHYPPVTKVKEEEKIKNTKTCDLIGEDLDYAVAYSKGYTLQTAKDINGDFFKEEYKPSTNWKRGGYIIEEKKITIIGYDNQWEAHLTVGSFVDSGVGDWVSGPTPLIAAMRAYVQSVLGEEINMLFIRAMFKD